MNATAGGWKEARAPALSAAALILIYPLQELFLWLQTPPPRNTEGGGPDASRSGSARRMNDTGRVASLEAASFQNIKRL